MTIESEVSIIIFLKQCHCDILGREHSHVEAEVCESTDKGTPKIQMSTYFDIIFKTKVKFKTLLDR